LWFWQRGRDGAGCGCEPERRHQREVILVSAQRSGAAVLWSKDMNAGQTFDTVTLRNPFADA
jgi:predicted nucleic acid-binding protein